METVKLFSFSYKIGDFTYGGHIPAVSWDDAQEKVKSFATVDGELVESVQDNICSVCRGDIVKDLTTPQPIEEVWPEELE